MFENILAFVRDVVVLGYMFFLRIGLPIIITLFLGWWLERKPKEWDAREIAELQARKAEEADKLRRIDLPLHM